MTINPTLRHPVTPLQGRLDLRMEIKKPLLTVEAVAAEIGGYVHSDGVLSLIEGGLITWAWNVASPRSNRREIRVLRQDAESYALTGGFRPLKTTWPEVFRWVLMPHGHHQFPNCFELSKLMTFWSASSELGLDLIEEGCLRTAKGTSWRRGRGGSPVVTRESVEKFLRDRLL